MLADEGWDVGKGEQDTDEVKKSFLLSISLRIAVMGTQTTSV